MPGMRLIRLRLSDQRENQCRHHTIVFRFVLLEKIGFLAASTLVTPHRSELLGAMDDEDLSEEGLVTKCEFLCRVRRLPNQEPEKSSNSSSRDSLQDMNGVLSCRTWETKYVVIMMSAFDSTQNLNAGRCGGGRYVDCGVVAAGGRARDS